MTTAGASLLVLIGLTKDSATYDARGWFIWSGAVFGAGVLVWIWFFLVIPLTMTANAYRVRTIAKARMGSNRGADPALEIIRAVYGAKQHDLDVTGAVALQATSDALDFLVTNEIAGWEDPYEGEPKTLTVKYRYGGNEATKTFAEGSQAKLP